MMLVGRALGPRSVEPLFDSGGRNRSALPLAADQPDLTAGSIWSVKTSNDGLVLLEELAAAGGARAELWEVARRFDADPSYPEEVIAESAKAVANPGLDAPGLIDLRTTPFVTIDNEDSRDLDQAMHIERAGDGYKVLYALADAAHYVPAGSALFDEALTRGASYYFPAFAIPMLPPTLSEGLISLNPGVDRRALVFDMTLDRDGACTKTEVYRAVIHSHGKLAYDRVQDYYDSPEGHPYAQQPYSDTLDLLAEVGKLRIADAEARNVVRYNRIGVSVGFTDERGARFRAFAEIRNDCEKYNEQISLLCNIQGAHLLVDAAQDATAQPVFRVHPSPPPERLADLADLIQALIRAHQLPDAQWAWHPSGSESLADYIRRLPKGGKTGDDKLVRVARSIERAALLTNLRSSFEAEPGRHFGVGAEVYARLSSPMREVVGVFTHKELLEALDRRQGGGSRAVDDALRHDIVAAANASKLKQKRITNACNKLVIDHHFAADLERPLEQRQSYPATILGIRSDRMYVQLDAPPLELKVYLADIAQVTDGRPDVSDDLVVVKAQRGRSTIRWTLGEAIDLRVLGYHKKRQRWMLAPTF